MSTRTDRADEVLQRALELAAAGTDTPTAVAELAALAGTDEVRTAQTRLLSGLARNPFFDPTGVRAARLLFAALDVTPERPELAVAA